MELKSQSAMHHTKSEDIVNGRGGDGSNKFSDCVSAKVVKLIAELHHRLRAGTSVCVEGDNQEISIKKKLKKCLKD